MSLSTAFIRTGALLSLALPITLLLACGSSDAGAPSAADAGIDVDSKPSHPHRDASSGDDDDGGDAASEGGDAGTGPGGALGGDAGTLAPGFTCSALPGAHPLAQFTFNGIVVSGDATQTVVVPDGFVVSGKVTAPLGDGKTLSARDPTLVVSLFDPAKNATYQTTTGASTYEINVPAGRYYAEYEMIYTVLDTFGQWDGGPLNHSILVRGVEILDVCGDIHHDVKLREMPELSPTTITISSLEKVHLATYDRFWIGLFSKDETIAWTSQEAASTTSIKTLVPLNEAFGVRLAGDALPDLTSSGAIALAMPDQVTTSGSITRPSSTLTTNATCSVPPRDPAHVHLGGDAWSFVSPEVSSASNAYTLVAPAGTACDLTARVRQDGYAVLSSPSIPLSGLHDETHDFVEPTLPPFVHQTIHVVDARGAPLADATPRIRAHSLPLASAGGWQMDMDGLVVKQDASLLIPPGTYSIQVGIF